MSGPIEILEAEITHATLRDLRIVQIRVTDDAIAGAPVATMLTPERLRLLAPTIRAELGADHATVAADTYALDRWRELVVHPDDWRAVLHVAAERGQITSHHRLIPGPRPVRIEAFYGIPIADDTTS